MLLNFRILILYLEWFFIWMIFLASDIAAMCYEYLRLLIVYQICQIVPYSGRVSKYSSDNKDNGYDFVPSFMACLFQSEWKKTPNGRIKILGYEKQEDAVLIFQVYWCQIKDNGWSLAFLIGFEIGVFFFRYFCFSLLITPMSSRIFFNLAFLFCLLKENVRCFHVRDDHLNQKQEAEKIYNIQIVKRIFFWIKTFTAVYCFSHRNRAEWKKRAVFSS